MYHIKDLSVLIQLHQTFFKIFPSFKKNRFEFLEFCLISSDDSDRVAFVISSKIGHSGSVNLVFTKRKPIKEVAFSASLTTKFIFKK